MNAKKIIHTYIFISGAYTLAAAFIWGINTLFLLDAGLSVTEVFFVNAAFSIGTILFEIPTGIVADTWGRRTSFLLSLVVLSLSTLAYVASAHYSRGMICFAVTSALMGLGFTFYSGAVEAWLVDALATVSYKKSQLDRVFTRGFFASGVAMLLGTVLGGFAGELHLSLPFIIRASLLAIVFAVAFFLMKDLGFQPRSLHFTQIPSEMKSILKASVKSGWGNKPMRLLMIASSIQTGFLTWAFYAWQPYFLELLQKEAVWVAGIIAALISLSTMLGNTIVEWFTRYCGKRTTLLIWGAAIQTIGAVVIGLSSSFWLAAGALLFVTGAMGVMGPVRQAFIHQLIESKERATIISLDSMLSGLGSSLSQPALGHLAQKSSYSMGYIIGGVATIIVWPVLYAVRKINSHADQIIGSKATLKESCPRGLPKISGVDSQVSKHQS